MSENNSHVNESTLTTTSVASVPPENPTMDSGHSPPKSNGNANSPTAKMVAPQPTNDSNGANGQPKRTRTSSSANGEPTSGPSPDDCSSSVFHEAQRTVRKHGGVKRNRADVDQIVTDTEAMLAKKESPCLKVANAATVVRALSIVAMSVPLDEDTRTKERPRFEVQGMMGDVIWDDKAKKLMFAVWKKAGGEKVRLHPVYAIDPNDESRGYYIPPNDPFDSIEKKVIVLPTGARPYGTTAQLIEKMKRFIRDFYHAPEIWVEIMAYFALMTWVTEAFTAVPYLRWLGEPETGKTRGLAVVAQLSYRPTSIGGSSSTPPLFRLVEKWQGTLVVDEADFRSATEMWDAVSKILNQGYLRYWAVMRSDGRDSEPRPFDVFGPKILSTRQPFSDIATETRCITFPTSEVEVPLEIPLQLKNQFYGRGQELQNELLQWRVDNLGRIEVDEQEIRKQHGSRLAQIGSSLLAVVEDAGARQRIIEFLGKEGVREKRNRQAVLVLEALRRIDEIDVTDEGANPNCEECCHLPRDGTVLIMHVTCFANKAARTLGNFEEKAPGSKIYLSMREAGSHLRSLGFNPKRTKKGNEVFIDSAHLEKKLKQYHSLLND